jgi:hypothetical protein
MAYAEVGPLDVDETQEICGQRRDVGQLRALVVGQGEGGMHGGGRAGVAGWGGVG